MPNLKKGERKFYFIMVWLPVIKVFQFIFNLWDEQMALNLQTLIISKLCAAMYNHFT